MKVLFLFLILPVFSFGQTIHIKDDKIVYEGKEKSTLPTKETFSRILQALPNIVDNYSIEQQSEDSIVARGELKLKAPHHIVRTVHYFLKINSTENGYEYLIDSVLFKERQRGEEVITIPSEKVVKNMDETGKVVGVTEKILNETDMKFQKLLALLRRETKKD